MGAAVRAQGTATPRQLAPGVLVTIPPSLAPEDTVITRDVVEIRSDPELKWDPEFLAVSDTLHGKAAGVKFRRDIWCLEFTFKPMRMIEVELPVAGGGTERKHVWYLLYRVRNTGQILRPVEGEGGVFAAEVATGEPMPFLPQFVLESQDRDAAGQPAGKAYLDRVIPRAIAAIKQRERIGQPLHNSVSISQQPIPVSGERLGEAVWGVAAWVDVDPRVDFFSVYVSGLTNAYRWEDVAGGYQPGDPPGRGRILARKMLQLNFWRPGDEIMQHEREFRYGVPIGKAHLYGVSDGVAYRWVYR